jgi:hypothetical protein
MPATAWKTTQLGVARMFGLGTEDNPVFPGMHDASALLTAPERMTEGASATFVPFESGYDPGDAADRAIMATRNQVFPRHGLTRL